MENDCVCVCERERCCAGLQEPVKQTSRRGQLESDWNAERMFERQGSLTPFTCERPGGRTWARVSDLCTSLSMGETLRLGLAPENPGGLWAQVRVEPRWPQGDGFGGRQGDIRVFRTVVCLCLHSDSPQ